MLTFREFTKLEESAFSDALASGMRVGNLSDSQEREKLNILLDQVTAEPFITPYVGFDRLRKVLAHYNIWLQSEQNFEGESGDLVFAISETEDMSAFGKVLDMTTIETKDTGIFVYFMYDMADDGFYDIVCSVVDEDELYEMLEAFENEEFEEDHEEDR